MEFQDKSVPLHVAIIMDGNGRWAKNKNQPRVFGHHSGAKRVREIVEAAGNLGVKHLTLYAFSEENWSRPRDEINALFKLLTRYLREEIDQLDKNNVKLSSIGNQHKIPKECQQLLAKGEAKTANNDGLQLVLALSYGARNDILKAVRALANKVLNQGLPVQAIDEKAISSALSTCAVPDPDLVIRTSGEQRLSNFLLWEASYSELYFTDKHWPDFNKEDFLAAISAFNRRSRRFGGVENIKMRLAQVTPAKI